MAAKYVRREVVREVTEVLEAFKEEEEVDFKEVDMRVAGNIHKDRYCLLYTSDAADDS